MGAISSISYVDNSRKFISFGEDKRVIQYEVGY